MKSLTHKMEGDLGGPVAVAALDTRVEVGVLLRHEGLGNLLVAELEKTRVFLKNPAQWVFCFFFVFFIYLPRRESF